MTQSEDPVGNPLACLPQWLREVGRAKLLYQHLTEVWHQQPPGAWPFPDDRLDCLEALHACNVRLWHTEDQVRRPGASDHTIAVCKRTIDRLNQQRHDHIERLDALLYRALYDDHDRLRPGAELHSETPGSLVDRLSIATLKVYHMAREAGRDDATAQHRQRCRQRLAVLEEQRDDLHACLSRLCLDLWYGRKRFKRYRQFKMYNDPELNPEIYRHRAGQQSRQK